MVLLETSRAVDFIKNSPYFWMLAAQIDAATDEEERLLDQVTLAPWD